MRQRAAASFLRLFGACARRAFGFPWGVRAFRGPLLVTLAWILGLGALASARAGVPAELTEAFNKFRADPPPGWAYSQTTTAEGKSMVEHCDAARPDFDRWKLVQKDGHAPADDDLREYGMARAQRSRNGAAPKLIDQFDLSTMELVSSTSETASYRFRLRPGDSRDRTAAFLRATVILHKPTQTITAIELGSIGEFSPTFGVKISEMKTVMTYSLPNADAPSLPQKVETRVRGRAFWVKSLDAEMVITFSDYVNTRAKQDQGPRTKD